ncbi:MAG: 30S ribosomal protein S3 [uncultured bacterium]|nr:MAG: 30S ribosomal protein S3 [uncultured bacterium]OGH13755.1 MAG: 30S ribosomal protein S3 [Candidatus Levybacteria bacterium RIFCSPHIGHO2_01_FULL_38_26]
MGQKVNPKLLRLGPVYNWSSRWFEDKKYKDILIEDRKIRKALTERLKNAGVSDIEIERSINNMGLKIYVSRPGIVIGRGGSGLEDLKKFINEVLKSNISSKQPPKIDIRIEAIKEPNLDAYLVASNISDQLLRRLPHRRIMTQAVEKVMFAGAKGVRIVLSGRIGGAEIGRREKQQKGTVPLSTIREHINFSSVPALTKKGYIGVKVWINRGDK